MAIEGLMVPQAQMLFRPGSPDISEAVSVTLEAYRDLGYAGDPENAERKLTEAFQAPASLGYDGRLYVPVPSVVTTERLLTVADDRRPDGISPIMKYTNLWIPGTKKESYTQDELDRAPAEPSARIAVFNADKATGVDPLLHHLNLPYDGFAKDRWGGQTTQLDAVEKDRTAFEAKHPGFVLTMTGHREFALFALMDRIRGEKPEAQNYVDPRSEEFVLNRGFMRITKELGRRSVDGGSIVGYVDSVGGRLDLDRSYGGARSRGGVGLSVGSKELEPQAS